MADAANLVVKVKSTGIEKTTKGLKKLERQGKESTSSIKALSGAFAALGVGALAKGILQTNIEFETLRTSLITTTGSMDAAAAAFEKVQKFAAKTPFAVKELTDAFIKLSNLGLDPSEEALTSLGNTAGAMGKSLNQAVEAVADAVTGEFERLKEFGIKAKSEGDNVTFTFQGVSTQIGKNSAEIQKYLLDIGNVQFAGGMDRQAATLQGAISNLGDSWDNFSDKILNDRASSGLRDSIKSITEGINSLSNNMDGLAIAGQGLVVLMGSRLVGSLAMASRGMNATAFAAAALRVSMGFLGGPLGVILTAAGALAIYAADALAAKDNTELLAKSVNHLTVAEAKKRLLELGNTFTNAAELADGYAKRLEAVKKVIADNPDRPDLVVMLDSINKGFVVATKRATEYARIQKSLQDIIDDPDREGTLKRQSEELAAKTAADLAAELKKLNGTISVSPIEFEPSDGLAYFNDLLQASEMLSESLRTPQEIFADEIEKLNELRDIRNERTNEGILSAENYSRAVTAAQDRLTDSIVEGNLTIDDSLTKTKDHFSQFEDAVGSWGASFAQEMIDGSGSFKNFANSMIKDMAKIALQQATQPIFNAIFKGLTGGSGGFVVGTGGGAGGVVPGLEGGGFTGNGARSGGVDGKGGFPAILHPQETVIDHAQGGSMGNVSVVVNVDASGTNTQGDGEGKDIGKAIGVAVRNVLIQEKRSGGLLA